MVISADTLQEMYSKGEIEHYFCRKDYKASNTFNITIRLAKACNLCCDFCIQGKSYKRAYEDVPICNARTYELIDKLNEELKQMTDKKVIIRLYGGEPFLFDVAGIINRIEPAKNKVTIKVVTNGTFFNKIIECSQIQKKRMKIRFAISIHEDYVDAEKILKNMDTIDPEFIDRIAIVATGNNDEFIDDILKRYSDKYKILIQPLRDKNTKIVDERIVKKYANIIKPYLLDNDEVPLGYLKNNIQSMDLAGYVCKSDTFLYYDHDLKDYVISICAGRKSKGVSLKDERILREYSICESSAECTGCTITYAFKLKD